MIKGRQTNKMLKKRKEISDIEEKIKDKGRGK